MWLQRGVWQNSTPVYLSKKTTAPVCWTQPTSFRSAYVFCTLIWTPREGHVSLGIPPSILTASQKTLIFNQMKLSSSWRINLLYLLMWLQRGVWQNSTPVYLSKKTTAPVCWTQPTSFRSAYVFCTLIWTPREGHVSLGIPPSILTASQKTLIFNQMKLSSSWRINLLGGNL